MPKFWAPLHFGIFEVLSLNAFRRKYRHFIDRFGVPGGTYPDPVKAGRLSGLSPHAPDPSTFFRTEKL